MKSFFNKSASGKGFENLKSLKKEFEDIKYESGHNDFDPFFITTIREIGLQNAFDSYEDAKKHDKKHPDFFMKISLTENVDLEEISYFKQVLEKVQPTINHINQKKADGEPLDDGELQTLQHLTEWTKHLKNATILKIEDNGTGLKGLGSSNDKNNASTRAITGSSSTNKSSGKGGSFGKGAKTAIFLSKLNTVFYHSVSSGIGGDVPEKSLGHTILPSFLADVVRGDSIGEDTFCVSDEHDESKSATPTWHKGAPYDVFKRTIDGTGLTVSAVSIKSNSDWQSHAIYAIATSHVFKLIDDKFASWKIQIGDIILTNDNFIAQLEEIATKDFIRKRHNKNCNLQIHYYMSLAASRRNLERIELTPVKYKLKNGTTDEGSATLLLGTSADIASLNDKVNAPRIENQFLFVNNGMIIRSGKTLGRQKTTFLKIEDWYSKYFGYILLDDVLCDVFRQAEEPSHDKINSLKLNEKDNDQIPNQKNLNSIITSFEDQIMKILNSKEDVEGDESDMAFGSFGADEDQGSTESPWKKIVFQPKAKPYSKSKKQTISTTHATADDQGKMESPRGKYETRTRVKTRNTGSGRNGGMQNGSIKFKTTRIITSSDNREFHLTLIADLKEEFDVKKIILRQEVTENGRSSAIDKEYEIEAISINDIRTKATEITEKHKNQTIKSSQCRLRNKIKTDNLRINLKVRSSLIACPKLSIILLP
jgi:hypothetical protein